VTLRSSEMGLLSFISPPLGNRSVFYPVLRILFLGAMLVLLQELFIQWSVSQRW